MLRHIIYDIPPEEDMSIIKKKYYKDYYKTDTDTFYLCQNKQEIDGEKKYAKYKTAGSCKF